MKYARPEFGDKSVKTQKVRQLFTGAQFDVPLFDTPITPKENFLRAVSDRSPLWMPCSLTDFQSLLTHDVAGRCPDGMQIHSDIRRKATEDYVFLDWFGTSWTWVCSQGGAMLTPGTKLLSDITNWESEIVWPDFSMWGFEEKASQFMRDEYDPDKVMHYDFGRGCTERLVSVLGGYTDSMEALVLEPEAVLDFFERYTDFLIALFDEMMSLYPLDMVTLHDDWGTERDTFFSEKMMENLVFAPTKRLIDYVKSKGVIFELHTCGNITRFMPYMASLGVDILQLQRRAVDTPAMKAKFGDTVGFCAQLEGLLPGINYSDEQVIDAVRKTVDIFAPGGGCYSGVFLADTKNSWTAVAELFTYSREYYDNN